MIRMALLTVVIALAAAVGFWRSGEVKRSRVAVAEAAAALVEQTTLADEAAARLEQAKRALAEQRRQSSEVAMRAAGLAGAVATGESLTEWSQPPKGVSSWSPSSPFVWIEKAMLSELPIQPFDDSGALDSGAGEVLAIPPEQIAALNRKAMALLADYRDQEATRAVRVSPSADSSGEPPDPESVVVRVEPDPEAARKMKAEFLATMREHFGQQRADLLEQAAAEWVGSQTGGTEPIAKTITVARTPDGLYQITVKTGTSWMSTAALSFENYVPEHLRSFFAPLLSASSGE